jgi:serine/threonine protein kinase
MKGGDTVDGFELVRLLGEGGNADVWEARHAELGVVALKILRSRRVQSEPYARFRQETQTLQHLGRRPGVLPVLASDVPETLAAEGRAWFAMRRPFGSTKRSRAHRSRTS